MVTFAVVLAVMVFVTEIQGASDHTGAAFGDATAPPVQSVPTAPTGPTSPTSPTSPTMAPAAPSSPMATTATMRPPAGEHFRDPGFERGLGGWRSLAGKLQPVTVAHTGNWGATLTGAGGATMTSGPITRVKAGKNYYGTIWIRSDQPGADVQVRVLERVNGRPFATDVVGDIAGTGWKQMEVIHTGHRNGAVLEMQVAAVRPRGAVFVDDASLRIKGGSPMSGMSP